MGKKGIKWVSMRMDYASFKQYKEEGVLTYANWISSLRGKKIFEIYASDDLHPFFYSIGYGLKLFSKISKKVRKALLNRIRLLKNRGGFYELKKGAPSYKQ